MAEIDSSTDTCDADEIMTVGVAIEKAMRAVDLTSTGEENAGELVVVRLCIKPIYGFYRLLNWYLPKLITLIQITLLLYEQRVIT